MISSRKTKAIGLFSGGLDSILAAKLVTEQGIDAVALHFKVPFAAPSRDLGEDRLRRYAELVGASFVSVDVGPDYLAMVKTPQYGYSRGVAPCIDCILYMLLKAKELAKTISADFVFTGEVVGQRSHCQNKRSLRMIEKEAGMGGRLLRPLCAKLLDPTIPELSGVVRRERLLDLKGRGRRRQIRLAHEFGIIDYAPPTGGCLLTDVNLAARVRDAIDNDQLELDIFPLLRHGRHFRIAPGVKVVAGRNEKENRAIESLAVDSDVVCRPVDVMGPVVVLRAAKPKKKDIQTAASICARYSDAAADVKVVVDCGGKKFKATAAAEDDLAAWLIRPMVEPPEPQEASDPDEREEAE